MRRIGLSRKQVLPAHIVEGVNFVRIAREGTRSGQLHGVKTRPEAILIPEGAQAAFG
jgi:hypothetical protein